MNVNIVTKILRFNNLECELKEYKWKIKNTLFKKPKNQY
jgi:hypothetical protein